MSNCSHNHDHRHGHQHHSHFTGSRIGYAVAVNLILTVVLLAGAAWARSLALAADAFHNLGDCGALIIAYFAQKIASRPADGKYTYGYGRAEVLGTLLNSALLVVMAIFLLFEASRRISSPYEIKGTVVTAMASIALIIDLLTVWFLRESSKDSMNVRAAMIHNLADALASVVVMISGLVLTFGGPYWFDLVATLFIAAFMVYHGWPMFRRALLILMGAVPEEIDLDQVKRNLCQLESIESVHHVHVWQMDDKNWSFEAHVVVRTTILKELEVIKIQIRGVLERFSITHSTLEFEHLDVNCTVPEHQ